MENQESDRKENEIIVKEDAIITKELEAYNTKKAEIALAHEKYMPLTVEKDGVDVIHEARMDMKGRRINMTKAGEKLRAGAIAFQKRVIARAKELAELMEPIEAHLEEEENRDKEEKARIKAEEEAKIAARTKARVDRLIRLGCSWNGTEYVYETFALPMALITVCEDEQFDLFCGKIQEAVDKKAAEAKAEQERLAKVAEEEAKKKAEAEAEQKRVKEEQDRVAAEQEKERKRLAEESKKLQDERDRLEAEAKAKEEAEAKAKEEARIRAEEKNKARVEMLAAVGVVLSEGGTGPCVGDISDAEWTDFYSKKKAAWDAKEETRIKAETEARLKAEAEEKRLKAEAGAKAKADKIGRAHV